MTREAARDTAGRASETKPAFVVDFMMTNAELDAFAAWSFAVPLRAFDPPEQGALALDHVRSRLSVGRP